MLLVEGEVNVGKNKKSRDGNKTATIILTQQILASIVLAYQYLNNLD
jgi:hypothetical protein